MSQVSIPSKVEQYENVLNEQLGSTEMLFPASSATWLEQKDYASMIWNAKSMLLLLFLLLLLLFCKTIRTLAKNLGPGKFSPPERFLCSSLLYSISIEWRVLLYSCLACIINKWNPSSIMCSRSYKRNWFSFVQHVPSNRD